VAGRQNQGHYENTKGGCNLLHSYTIRQEKSSHSGAQPKQTPPKFRPSIIFSTDDAGRPVTYIVAQTEGEEEELLSILRSHNKKREDTTCEKERKDNE